MKKIILAIAFIFFNFNITFAQEPITNLNNLTPIGQMPSDEEIMAIIEKYNFADENQKQLIFQETKKQLQVFYTTGKLNIPNASTLENQETQEMQTDKRVKKYTNHEPLTRRSKERR